MINKDILRKLRLKLGISQDQFARKADVSYTTFTKIETGVIKNPSVFVIAKIARALNVKIESRVMLARNGYGDADIFR